MDWGWVINGKAPVWGALRCNAVPRKSPNLPMNASREGPTAEALRIECSHEPEAVQSLLGEGGVQSLGRISGGLRIARVG